MKNILILILIFGLINSCSYPEMSRNEVVYENNFEENSLVNINGGGIISYNNTKVLGNFNNESFTLHLNDIGDHEYVFLSFDLYIQCSWDGNFNGFNDDRPDKWILEFKPDMDLYKDFEFSKFETTFSIALALQIIVFYNHIQKITQIKITQKKELIVMDYPQYVMMIFLEDLLRYIK